MASVLTPPDARPDHRRAPGVDKHPHIIESLFPHNVVLKVPPKGIGGMPSNLIESSASYVMQLALPGVDVRSVDIESVGRRLVVKGKYRIPTVENASFLWHDIPDDEFCNMFELPAEVESNTALAYYDRGILTVELPKAARRPCISPTGLEVYP